ncbi:MAG: twin-arginine translocase subunit TatC [Solirubrobacterales bacterium]|nr:twin-arginine translocase subunit TatC [Solirubrobacterales bacterium]MBV9716963.1 twin-arginine translocase subunit TatC [Solirubrobacterales bacterium]
MAKVLRPIGHDDELSIVEHLDELRSRLMICGAVLVVAFGICFWQNHALLSVLNRALPHTSSSEVRRGLAGVPSQSAQERDAFLKMASAAAALAASHHLSAADRAAEAQFEQAALQAARALPRTPTTAQERPITIGVGEPFMTTLTVCAYFALLFSLPVLIYEGYGFVIPALSREERRAALPLMTVAPVLFIAGVVFAYAVVLPPAVHFLQGYNSEQFDILVQAKSYYTFQILTMLGIGLAFQLPLGLLGLQRLGVINGSTLTRHWRYATVIIAVIAAAMPGADPVTTGLETAPLVVLFLASIVLLKIADRRAAARAAAELAQADNGLDLT